jgi:hypothetical protein
MPLIPLTPAGNWPEVSTQGAWYVNFAGFGSVASSGSAITLTPASPTGQYDTHSGLVTTTASYNASSTPITINATVVNNNQLRQSFPPNPWEVGWTVWNFTNNTSFYYFSLKSNGWELGQANPAYPGAQRFLATGSTPSSTIGVPYNIKVVQTGNNIVVSINNVVVTNFTDTVAPYYSGKVGLYTEDASVSFSNVSVDNGGPFWSGIVSVTPTSVQVPNTVVYTYTVSNTIITTRKRTNNNRPQT